MAKHRTSETEPKALTNDLVRLAANGGLLPLPVPFGVAGILDRDDWHSPPWPQLSHGSRADPWRYPERWFPTRVCPLAETLRRSLHGRIAHWFPKDAISVVYATEAALAMYVWELEALDLDGRSAPPTHRDLAKLAGAIGNARRAWEDLGPRGRRSLNDLDTMLMVAAKRVSDLASPPKPYLGRALRRHIERKAPVSAKRLVYRLHQAWVEFGGAPYRRHRTDEADYVGEVFNALGMGKGAGGQRYLRLLYKKP